MWSLKNGATHFWRTYKKQLLIGLTALGLVSVGGVAALLTNTNHTPDVKPKTTAQSQPEDTNNKTSYYEEESGTNDTQVEGAATDEPSDTEEKPTNITPTPTAASTPPPPGQEYGIFGEFTVNVNKDGTPTEAVYATSDDHAVQWSGTIPAHNQSKVSATMPLVSSAKNYTVTFQALPAATVGDKLTYTITAGTIPKQITVVIVE